MHSAEDFHCKDIARRLLSHQVDGSKTAACKQLEEVKVAHLRAQGLCDAKSWLDRGVYAPLRLPWVEVNQLLQRVQLLPSECSQLCGTRASSVLHRDGHDNLSPGHQLSQQLRKPADLAHDLTPERTVNGSSFPRAALAMEGADSGASASGATGVEGGVEDGVEEREEE
eukprot:CAMPEP_0181240476 /NCGR_PEP_ID=MMETSP1096-20121128/40552_2 /TAXON_ID=156174 ORGANISM="Chrysochromulina ericina, Strain CCMP281" /NCGR_SAMPLE_ID=MMETSP1096 /ASSEMBLY_ACC=CAM_ASM_000453 /LENGTH=168 /DNA_ID=CAMNT_0023336371 /DNA_START=1559 /DNA_END=2063 /DNA_ORIENTATION=-